MIISNMLFGNIKMNIRFIIAFILMMADVAGNATPPSKKGTSTPEEKINETKTLNVIRSSKQFLFREIIVSVIKDTDTPFQVVFNLIVEREKDQSFSSQENDIPLIIDTLLSKLLPNLNQFQKEITNALQTSLEKYIFRLLKAKFDWIKNIKVQNLRVQQVDPNT